MFQPPPTWDACEQYFIAPRKKILKGDLGSQVYVQAPQQQHGTGQFHGAKRAHNRGGRSGQAKDIHTLRSVGRQCYYRPDQLSRKYLYFQEWTTPEFNIRMSSRHQRNQWGYPCFNINEAVLILILILNRQLILTFCWILNIELSLSHKSDPRWTVGTCSSLLTNEFSTKSPRAYGPRFGGNEASKCIKNHLFHCRILTLL